MLLSRSRFTFGICAAIVVAVNGAKIAWLKDAMINMAATIQICPAINMHTLLVGQTAIVPSSNNIYTRP